MSVKTMSIKAWNRSRNCFGNFEQVVSGQQTISRVSIESGSPDITITFSNGTVVVVRCSDISYPGPVDI